MTYWIDDLLMLSCEGVKVNAVKAQAGVLVSVIRTQGSCPRNASTRMIVTAERCLGTIGGGHLEYQVIDIAKTMLVVDKPLFRIERFALGARLGQCCGGVVHISFELIPADQPVWIRALKALHERGEAAVMVSQLSPHAIPTSSGSEIYSVRKIVVSAFEGIGKLENTELEASATSRALSLLSTSAHPTTCREENLLFEILPANALHVAVFGAGHVGKALVNILATMPCRISWFDSRACEFPDKVAGNVNIICCDHPEQEVDDLPQNSHVVIMTHSHTLDEAICERALRRDDFAFCGLIGSLTKRRQFKKRLLAKGLSAVQWSGLTCPIGEEGIEGKHPSEIAIAVSAQILRKQNSALAITHPSRDDRKPDHRLMPVGAG